MRSGDPFLFFSDREKKQIVASIQEAEMNTSGEIRVHLERKADPDIISHAGREFERLGMTKTKDHNGILIFLGIRSKRFALLGDRGINEKVPEGFWDDIVRKMAGHFHNDEFADGISEAVLLIGERLREFFPYQRDDINELPDEISFSV